MFLSMQKVKSLEAVMDQIKKEKVQVSYYVLAENIAKYIPILAHKARSLVRDLDPTNDLSFLRIKTKLNEILIAPDKDFLIIVI